MIDGDDNLNFTAAIQTANQAGLKVAWSNDAFELWILLHFEEVPYDNMLHRDYIYQRLTDILRTFPSINAQYDRIIQNGSFNYKAHLRNVGHFWFMFCHY